MSKSNNRTTPSKISDNSTKSDQKIRSTKPSTTKTLTKTSTTKTSTTKTPVAGTSTSKQLKTRDSNKDEEKTKLINKPSVQKTLPTNTTVKSTAKTKPSPSLSPATKTKPKLTPTTKIKVDSQTPKQQPLKSNRNINVVNKTKILNPGKPNLVKDTYHNVTVASPPSVRKQNSKEFESLPPESTSSNTFPSEGDPKLQERRKTITLEPDEAVVLKKLHHQVPQNVDAHFGNTVKKKTDGDEDILSPKEIKEPVAFEINFDDETKRLQTLKETAKNDRIQLGKKNEEDNCNCSDEYEDDFESYESDFETGSSSAEAEEDSEESLPVIDDSNKNISETNNIKDDDLQIEEERNEHDDDEDDSESETQPPITVIHRQEKESEKKLDSGNYDLKSTNYNNKLLEIKINSQQQQQQSDSLDTATNNSDRLDSGIETQSNNKKNGIASKAYYSREETEGPLFPVTKDSQRGIDLMQKIKFDEITFHLFEMKPLDYELFMKIYGNLNCAQSSSQTNEHLINTEIQTDEFQCRNMWTQYPPHFDSTSTENSKFMHCGEEESSEDEEEDISLNSIDISIKALKKFTKDEMKNKNKENRNVIIDFEKLNDFLNRYKIPIFETLNRNSKSTENSKISKSSFSNGYRNLNANFLNALKVVKIFSKVKFNFIFTIHESAENVYKYDFRNLIVVWSTSDLLNPIRLLSSWNQVTKLDLCADSTDIVVSGLKDGSIALWDLRETYSYCSKLDGYLSHFAAIQSIVPIVPSKKGTEDLGSVVDIKSFKSETGAYALKSYKQKQFVSLNDTGIIAIWSLVEINQQQYNLQTPPKNIQNLSNAKSVFLSPWARIKIVQSAICDLGYYFEMKSIKTQSKFEQTVLYFESDIFDDKTLQELQKSNNNIFNEKKSLGIRFAGLDTSSNNVYVATNKNFILACSKTLKPERFRKIYINESLFMFPTAICLHPNEEFLIVGLSNGSVVAINCNENKTFLPDDSELDEPENANQKSNSDLIDMNEAKKIQSSCAIQNILREERKMFEELEHRNSYFAEDVAFRPRTAIPEFENQNTNENPDEIYKMFDQQVLLNGSILRKNLVECIEISKDGQKLYCLSDGDVKIYDFKIGMEIKSSKDEEIKGISLTKSESDSEHVLVVLKADNIVEIHKVKI